MGSFQLRFSIWLYYVRQIIGNWQLAIGNVLNLRNLRDYTGQKKEFEVVDLGPGQSTFT
ncbi:MAG TPA: hypothetical protein VJM12_10575 [Pyrinomonadaceae bacterium]|nr:hypothetical protein [Pyrinomonadaceae bacterium]